MPRRRLPDGAKEILEDIRSVLGAETSGFITQEQLGAYLGRKRRATSDFIRKSGLRPFNGNESHRTYYIYDVAQAIWEGLKLRPANEGLPRPHKADTR